MSCVVRIGLFVVRRSVCVVGVGADFLGVVVCSLLVSLGILLGVGSLDLIVRCDVCFVGEERRRV